MSIPAKYSIDFRFLIREPRYTITYSLIAFILVIILIPQKLCAKFYHTAHRYVCAI